MIGSNKGKPNGREKPETFFAGANAIEELSEEEIMSTIKTLMKNGNPGENRIKAEFLTGGKLLQKNLRYVKKDLKMWNDT